MHAFTLIQLTIIVTKLTPKTQFMIKGRFYTSVYLFMELMWGPMLASEGRGRLPELAGGHGWG